MIERKISKIRSFLRHCGSDAFLLSALPNIRYISGFSGTSAWLLITKREQIFVTDFRYKLQSKKELKGRFEIKLIKGSINSLIKNIALQRKINSLCFEAEQLTVARYNQLKTILKGKVRLIPTKNVIQKHRLIKTPAELRLIQTAVTITKKSLLKLEPFIKSGVTEIFLKNKLEQILKSYGGQKTAFDIIVASGTNAAMPHAQTTQKEIKNKEPIIIDVGVDFKGYKSDLTRTFFSGKITQYDNYYKLVATAQDRAIKLIRPQVKIQKIDHAARQTLKVAGLSQYFGHALGHGIGLEVHEAPRICAKNKQRLKAGMVFTIEPGIYIPGWGGIRIEDMVVVTKKGYKIL